MLRGRGLFAILFGPAAAWATAWGIPIENVVRNAVRGIFGLGSMWKSTRMVVLTSVVAALYVCIMIPFKILPIIPGWTEIRPGVLVPLLGSILFGPAAAWGAAIGNVVGDVLGGMFGLGSIFGFAGNFLLGFLPYKILENIARKPAAEAGYVAKVFAGILGSLACAAVIAWGVDLMGFVQFPILAGAISINNVAFSIVFPAVLLGLYPRIKRMGLLYTQIMPEREISRGFTARVLGPALVIMGVVGALIAGFAINAAGAAESIKYGVSPFIGAILLGCLTL